MAAVPTARSWLRTYYREPWTVSSTWPTRPPTRARSGQPSETRATIRRSKRCRCGPRALRIFEATYGPNHPQVALINVGNARRGLGQPALAVELLERALRIHERTHRPDH